MRSTLWKAGIAAVSVIALAGLGVASATAASPAKTHAPITGTKIIRDYVTYYGWYDNTPPGCGTAFGGCAGGTGTYKDPITFASDKAEFPVGTIIYYETTQKYFKMGDSCGECTQDWSNPNGGPDGGPGLYHTDLWLGGKGGNEFDAIDCEDALTQGTLTGAPLLTPMIVNPPSNLPVSSEALFNSKTNKCFGGMATSTSNGQYSNGSSHLCISGGSTAGSAVGTAACNGSADQNLAYNGAFFMINKLCLNATTGISKPGSTLDLESCSGGPNEQWEINSNGTLGSIQVNLCIEQSGTTLETAKCSTASDQKWTYKSESAPS